MKKYDLTIGTNGTVKAFNYGFFEKTADLSLAPMPELVEIGNYRMKKSEYKKHSEAFDRFLSK